MILKLDGERGYSGVTPKINYTPEPIDEYLVMVNLPEDWEEIHNYIINENEIDGIPNRKITCSNTQSFSLRSAIYEMSVEEANILRTHEKVDSIELNPEKYPQPQSLLDLRFRKNIAFNKPPRPATFSSTSYTNGVRGNWGHLFVNNPSSEPYQGVGIVTTDSVDRDLSYSLSGKNIDVVTIDSGVGALHPEFLDVNGKSKVKDVILDGPFKVDPDYFIGLGVTYTKVLDGVDIGVGIATTSAEEWWENTSKRSSTFSSLGTITIPSSYTLSQALSKTSGVEPNYINNTHGTACASTTCGKSFGLAFNSNVWTIRITLGTDSVNGVISSSVALNACAIWHQAKKLNSADPDPTLINNSYGSSSETGNTSGTSYNHVYRGSNLTYTGTGSVFNVASNAGACRNTKTFTRNTSGSSSQSAYSGSGGFINSGNGSTGSAAENAIASGCIVVAAAGNENQKLSDKDDVDFDNSYVNAGVYINRVGGVQQGFSGDHEPGKGSIRVGAIDCGVEPFSEKQGVTKYKVRKAVYSNNGPMIDIFAPAEMTMCGAYGSDENYQRQDNSNFYDDWFNGTSCAAPQVCGVIALYLESNRKANQDNVRYWLNTSASKKGQLSDPYSGVNDVGYWSQTYNSTYDEAELGESYNVRGNGNLRGAPNRVLYNPYVNNYKSSFFIDDGNSIITSNLELFINPASYLSGTTVPDSSGNSRTYNLVNGVVHNTSPARFTFDGANDYMEVVSNYNIVTGNATFVIWIKRNGNQSTWTGLFYNRESSVHGLGFSGSSHEISYTWNNVNNTWSWDSDLFVDDATWTMVALSVNPSTAKGYTYTSSSTPSTSTNTVSHSAATFQNIEIGRDNYGGRHFKGDIGHALFYSSTLTDTEITQIYNATKSNYGYEFNSGSSIITTNLVLHLDVSNSNSYSGSGTTWTDLSGNSNNGTLENGVSYSSSDGGYLVFDGSNDFISFTDDSDFNLGTGDFTYETWIQITGSYMRLGSFINDSDTQASPNFTVRQNEIYCYSNITNVYLLRKTIVSNTNTWYHVVFTRVGTDLKLYRNGVLIDSVSNISTNFVDDRLVIGRNHSGTAYATGHMAQARLYKGKGLSASEVLQNYNATKSNYVESTTNKITFNNLQIGLPPILPKLKIIHEIVTTNLILHLDAGNNSSYGGSGTTWTDLSGQGNHATLTNGPVYSSSDGGYFNFDGTNDYVSETSGLSDSFLQGNWSISFWINFETVNTSTSTYDRPLLHHGTRSTRKGLHLCNRDGKFHFGLYSDDLPGTATLSTNTWYNVVFTLNNTSYAKQIYINGSLDDSHTGGGAYTGTGSNSQIGGKALNFGRYFDGNISIVAAYNRVLTSAEVSQNYDVIKSRYGL